MKTSLLSLVKTCFLLSTLTVLALSCKKDGSKKFSQPPQSSPCKITDEDKSIAGTYEHYWYTYTKEGKLDSIYYSQIAGPKSSYEAWCKEDLDGFVWYSYANADGKKPDAFDYFYTGVMQDSSHFPTSLATSFQVYTDPNTASYGYSFQYKANGRLDGYDQTWPGPGPAGLLIGMGVEYTADGDVSTLDYNVTTGPRLHTRAATTGFDGHPTPWAAISGWIFLTPAVQWISADSDPILYGLSDHNPTGSVFTDNDGKQTQKEEITYEYNAQGQPTKRTVLRTGPTGNQSTYYHTYSCDCN